MTVMQSRKAAFLGFCESLQSRYIHTHAAFLSLLMCLYKEENWGHCVSNVVLRLNGNGAMPKPALETIGMLSRLWPPRIGKKVDEGRKWWDLHTDVNPGSAPLPASWNRNCIFLYENSIFERGSLWKCCVRLGIKSSEKWTFSLWLWRFFFFGCCWRSRNAKSSWRKEGKYLESCIVSSSA